MQYDTIHYFYCEKKIRSYQEVKGAMNFNCKVNFCAIFRSYRRLVFQDQFNPIVDIVSTLSINDFFLNIGIDHQRNTNINDCFCKKIAQI